MLPHLRGKGQEQSAAILCHHNRSIKLQTFSDLWFIQKQQNLKNILSSDTWISLWNTSAGRHFWFSCRVHLFLNKMFQDEYALHRNLLYSEEKRTEKYCSQLRLHIYHANILKSQNCNLLILVSHFMSFVKISDLLAHGKALKKEGLSKKNQT